MDNLPILIGASQYVIHEFKSQQETLAPVDLAAEALRTLITKLNCPKLADAIDTLVMTRLVIDSAERLKHPFGSSTKPPLSVTNRLGLSVDRAIYGGVGGQSPQRYVNEFAEAIYRGECSVVALCGAEATAAMKQSLRNGWQLDWSENPEGEFEDRGYQPIWTAIEGLHDIAAPTQVYALFENAWRHARGLSITQHRELMAKLFARFSDIAATNPYAQFPINRSAEFLQTASRENYPINEPYHKWLIAQDAVNQSAAIVMTSVGKARELGISEDQWVYLHSYADADDCAPSERANLATSTAINSAIEHALSGVDKAIADIEFLDLYSCFPIAVLCACDALGIRYDTERDLTVTGGLPFFGGPGNNYSLHAIAETHRLLCDKPGSYGLVAANGGYLSKQSVGIYSTSQPASWEPLKGNPAQAAVDAKPTAGVAYPFDGEAIITTYTLSYRKAEIEKGMAVCHDPISSRNVLAKADANDTETLEALRAGEPIGRRVTIRSTERGCYFSFV